jgi:hypothetical protein
MPIGSAADRQKFSSRSVHRDPDSQYKSKMVRRIGRRWRNGSKPIRRAYH